MKQYQGCLDVSYRTRDVNLILCLIALLKNIFNTRHSDIHNYETRNRLLLLVDKVLLWSTKLAIFYKGAVIFNDTL